MKRFTISPAMRYRDARAAIAFLERAFGFTVHALYADEPEGAVAHAELVYDDGMVMLGSTRDGDTSGMRNPRETGGTTHAIYVVVEDIEEHYRRARSAGARIERELAETDYGSRDYAARDPEGYLWSFGTYRPSDTHASVEPEAYSTLGG